jgi:16S rRNA (guanine(1405)-N(7))-methyltransferase
MADASPNLEQVVQDVLRGANYRGVSPDLVRRIARHELAIRRSPRDAAKATKNRLHQIYGAFVSAPIRPKRWLAELGVTVEPTSSAPAQNPTFREACARIMARHASTAERLAILPRFYHTILAEVPSIRAVLDLGCGLNPLAIPWMGLPPGVAYTCYDVDADLVAFLNGFFGLAGVDGRAEQRDLVSAPPTAPADLAFALKLLPTLDQIERDAGATLLRALHTPYLLVSFPAHSLCGRAKGMPQHYEARFQALATAEGWTMRRFSFPSELAFLVRRRSA